MALAAAFGLFGTNYPGFGNLDQRDAILFRSGARQPTAFGSVIAKFFGVGFIIVVNIDFHLEIRIAFDSFVCNENVDGRGKVPAQIFARDGTIPGHVNPTRWSSRLKITSDLDPIRLNRISFDEHDLFGKPVRAPDQVRGRLFRIML
jgi:hypothetical protein